MSLFFNKIKISSILKYVLGAAYPIAGPETLMEMNNSGRKARSKERKHRKDNRNTD